MIDTHSFVALGADIGCREALDILGREIERQVHRATIAREQREPHDHTEAGHVYAAAVLRDVQKQLAARFRG